MERVEGGHEFSLRQGPGKCAKGQPSPPPTPSVEVRVAGEAEIRGSLGECGLMSRGRTQRLGEAGTRIGPLPIPPGGPNSSPGVTAASPPLPRASPAPSEPRPSLPVPPSLYLVPPSLPPPNTSFSRLPPGAAKFLRSRGRAEPGPGGSSAPAALSPRRPRARPGPLRAMLCSHWRSLRRRRKETRVRAQVAAPLALPPPPSPQDGGTKRPGLRALKKMGQ